MSLTIKKKSMLFSIVFIFSITIALALTNNIDLLKLNSVSNQSQVLTFNPIQMPTTVDEDLVFDINYSHSPALDVKTSGVSFRLHWDSSQLEFQSISNLLNDNLLRQSVIRPDSLNFDNDELTDAYILFTWFDEAQQWPTNGFNPILLTGNFKTTLDFVSSTIKISAVTRLPDMELSPGVITSWNLRSQNLTAGALPNEIFSNGFELISSPTYLPQNVFLGDDTLCSTDIDGNGILEPLTDGILVSRFINGITGDSLVNGALGQGATRTNSAEIISFLQMSDCQSFLDIDANGAIEAGFDDILFVRWLFGYIGNDLTENALGDNYQRDGITDLNTWFETHSYYRTVTMNESIPAGTQATSSDGSVIVEPIDDDVAITVTNGLDADGDSIYNFDFQGEGQINITFGGLIQNTRSGSIPCNPAEIEDDYDVDDFQWQTNCAVFVDGQTIDFNRYPSSKSLPTEQQYIELNADRWFDLILRVKTSSQLTSSCRLLSIDGCLDKQPVLFIHGFNVDWGRSGNSGLGGSLGTWGEFPKLMESLGYTPFEFRWRSAAKFEDVAAELVEAVKLIESKTNQKVNIIAHSFGGVLTRTMLQGLAHGNPDTSNLVNKVVTVGTPHSGIMDSNRCIIDKPFPIGQHSFIEAFETCQQISCHQAGESTFDDYDQSFFDTGYNGNLIAKLSCISSSSPNCPVFVSPPDISEFHEIETGLVVLALIGLKKSKVNGNLQEGDGLIRYSGQRFLPEFSVQGSCDNLNVDYSLLKKGFQLSNNSSTLLYEKLLGTELDLLPGASNVIFTPPLIESGTSFNLNSGYSHTGALFVGGYTFFPEVKIQCSNISDCNHSTFENVREFFSELEVTIEQSLTQSDPTDTPPIIFDVAFNKDINYQTLSIDDFTVSPSGNVASFEIDPNDNQLIKIFVSSIIAGDTITVTMPAGKITDTYGNLNQASTSNDNQVTYNGINLNVTIDQHDLYYDPTGLDFATFNIVFSQPIDRSTFEYSDINIAGTTGSVSSLTSTDDINWELTISGLSEGETVTASLLEGVVQDANGNQNFPSTSTDNQVTYIPLNVTVNQSPTQDDPTNIDSANYVVEFSRAVDPDWFWASDITLSGTNGTVNSLSSSDNINWTFNVSGMNPGDTVTAYIEAGGYEEDFDYNQASTSTDNQVTYLDPDLTVEINHILTDPISDNYTEFYVVFNLPIDEATFETSDLTISPSGTVTNIQPAGNNAYNVAVGNISIGDTISLSMEAGKVSSLDSGKLNLASTSTDNQVTYIPLTVTVNQSAAQLDPTSTDLAVFEAVFSDAIDPTTFEDSDITLTGTTGSISSRTTSDNITWMFEVSGMTNGDVVTASLDAGVVFTLNSDTNLISTSTDNEVTYITPLNVTINQNPSQDDPTSVDSALFDIVFSRDIETSSFTSSDLTITGSSGTVNLLTEIDAQNWTAEITGMTDGDTVILSLEADTVQDSSGNINLASTSSDNQVTYINDTIDLNAGLVAHYPFDGNANDISGNGNNGTGTNMVLTTDRFGASNKAYLFNGSDSYITTNYTASQNLGKNMSFNLWVQWNGDNGEIRQRILTKWQEGGIGASEYLFGISDSNSNLQLTIGSSSGMYCNNCTFDNSWHMLSVTSDGTNVKFYVDGQFKFETTFSATVIEDNEPLIIGAGAASTQLPVYVFNGKMDDVRVYNRSINEQEIQELYNLSNPIDLNLGLVAHYPLDGNANDVSGSGNNGTENGGLSFVTGINGQAASFDGVDDYIVVPHSGSLALNRPLSLSYWISPEALNGVSGGVPVIVKNSHPDNNFSSWMTPDLDSIIYQQYPSNSGPQYTFTTGYDFTSQGFYHVVVVRSDNQIKTYINNQLISTDSADYDAQMDSENLFIGYDGGSGFNTLKGLLDDVRIYNRELNQQEIQELYNISALVDLNAGLIAHYPLDGNANDVSGNANNGTESGTVDYVAGRHGQAALFNDNTDLIVANDPLSSNMSSIDPFTVSFWVNTTTNKGSAGMVNQFSACSSDGEGNERFGTIIYNNADPALDRVHTWAKDYASDSIGADRDLIIDGNWHLLTIINQESTLQTYIDGVLQVEKTMLNSGTSILNGVQLAIGGYYIDECTTDSSFEGSIDDVRVYNRAINNAEIQELFSSTQQIIATQPLNDTGITWGGDYPSGNNATCTSNIASPQDCHQGRDATHNDDSDGHAGFSFTKLDASGNPLVDQSVDYATTPWACVKDNVTGLIWEVKTDDGGIHDKDNPYKWGGISRQGNYGNEFYDDWDILVNGANSENLCGFNNWRIPGRTELKSLIDHSRVSPAIDITYFPSTLSSKYWTASPYLSNSEDAWDIDFEDGNSGYHGRSATRSVRLVRK